MKVIESLLTLSYHALSIYHPKNVDVPIFTLKLYKPSIRLNFLTVKSPAKEDIVEAERVAERLEPWAELFKAGLRFHSGQTSEICKS